MATSTKGRPNQGKNGGFSNYSSDNDVRLDNNSQSDSLAILLIIVLLIVVLLFLPLLAWMYTDIRRLEIRVDKALQRIDGK